MKRRLTLAIGCLACAMPSIASLTSPSSARTTHIASAESRRLNFLGATQVAQEELERRGLAEAHTIASVVFLKGLESGTGHYDVRIEPPATLAEGGRLRGFCVTTDGAIQLALGFRTEPGHTLSTQTGDGLLRERSLGSDAGEG